MKEAELNIIARVLKSKGIAIDQHFFYDSKKPYAITMDDKGTVFLSHSDKDSIVFFSLLADFSELNLQKTFFIMHDALKANNINFGLPVDFSIDESGQFLVIWCKLKTIECNFQNIERRFEALCNIGKDFCDANEITPIIIDE